MRALLKRSATARCAADLSRKSLLLALLSELWQLAWCAMGGWMPAAAALVAAVETLLHAGRVVAPCLQKKVRPAQQRLLLLIWV